MTILCPKEFAEACDFAEKADLALEEAIEDAVPGEPQHRLAERRGQACRSLLRCISCLVRWDGDDGDRAGSFRPETRIVGYDGVVRTVGENPDASLLPRKETFLTADLAPHSFFFREALVDPETRQPVQVIDQLYYVFTDPKSSGLTREAVEAMGEGELQAIALSGGCVIGWRPLKDGELTSAVVRHVEKERRGLCGGIIWHPDYVDGKPAPYGRWSIHT